jgi:uncharacterized coiled-coil protein SlyX
MDRETHHITRVIDDLDHLQARQIAAFDHDLLPDLEQHCRERRLAMERLEAKINALTEAVQHQQTEETDAGILFLMTRISDLLNQNRILAKKVKVHKDGIERSMKTLAAGKKIIHSYGSPAMTSNQPRVISHTE